MELREAIEFCINKIEIENGIEWPKVQYNTRLIKKNLIEALSQTIHAPHELLGYYKSGISFSKAMRKAFASIVDTKPKNLDWNKFILYFCGFKYCHTCEKVLTLDSFYDRNNSANSGAFKVSVCIGCKDPTRGVHAKPFFSEEILLIKQFYKNRPIGYEVDHIIPLHGEKVCGLHALINLQYLSINDNRQKNNNIDINEVSKQQMEWVKQNVTS